MKAKRRLCETRLFISDSYIPLGKVVMKQFIMKLTPSILSLFITCELIILIGFIIAFPELYKL